MGEKLIAVVGGMVAAVLGIVIFDGINHLVYPPPLGFSYENSEMLKKFNFNAPTISTVISLSGLIFSSVIGGFVATKMDKTDDYRIPLIVGLLLFLQYSFNFYTIPHKTITVVLSLLLVIPASRLGYLLCIRYLKPITTK